MQYLLALVIFAIGFSAPAYAKWPTTIWTVLEDPAVGATKPKGERARFAQKYKDDLEHASFWFQSMGFKAPRTLNEEDRFDFKGDERYVAFLQSDPLNIGSSHSANGYMMLSTYLGILKPQGSIEKLFTATVVHELFHGIQVAYPDFSKYAYRNSKALGPTECGAGERDTAWLVEGTASAVQIQYLERTLGNLYGHAFKGSPRATWVRHFDQQLDWGRLPNQIRNQTRVHLGTPPLSWYCSYGTWYFWYAVGNMLGSKDPRDWRRTAYLRYIFEQEGQWQGTGLAMADSGLKRAAQELGAIGPYHGGFFALYPQFVAQYLDVDEFYEKVEDVTLTTPSLYETTSSLEGGPIEPIATRAWRFRIQLPANATSMPYTVRFVLESPDQDSLDGLHLIVDNTVIDHPADADTPYSHTRRTDQDVPNSHDELDYFVRVANVAPDAAATEPAEYALRVEVEGFYGETTSGPSNDAIAGELPPGFEITGPGKYWTCSGGDDARAKFTIMTPDGYADQLERLLPQGLQNLESDFDRLEMEAQNEGQDGKLKEIQQQRKKLVSQMQSDLRSQGMSESITQAAAQSRRKNDVTILANLYGTNTEGSCSMTLNVTLPGRQAAAQKVNGEHFSVMVTPESTSNAMAAMIGSVAGMFDGSASMTEPQGFNPEKFFDELDNDLDADWISCSANERNCDEGALTLEHARHDHLSGTFNFQVSRRNDDDHSVEYDTVTGMINVTSAQTEADNSLIDYMSRGQKLGEPLYVPGMERLLQGGSMFGK